MEAGTQGSGELTAFAPFETDKASTLPFKGNSKPTEQIEINDGGFPKVLFRKLQIPAPAGFGEVQRKSNAAPVRAVRSTQQRDREESRVYARPDNSTSVSVSNQPPLSAPTSQQPRAQVTKSLVLNRIGNLESNRDPTEDLKKYWMPDSACKECFECQTKFSLIVRRHHCRICGRIFCNACCSQTIPGVLLRPDLQGNLRVCGECLDIFQEFHTSKGRSESAGQTDSSQNSEIPHSPRPIAATPPKSQLELPLNLPPESSLVRGGSGTYSRSTRPMSILSPHKSWDDTSSIRSQEVEMSPSRMNFEFDNPTPLRSLSSASTRRQSGLRPVTSETEERLLALGEDEVEFTIHEVWFNMTDPVTGLQMQNHRYRLRAYPNTVTAHYIVEWLVTRGHSRSREVAVRVGQALVDTKRLKIVSSLDQEFKDESNIFLELGETTTLQPDQASPTVTDAPKWFQHLREDADSEYEVSAGVDINTMRAARYANPSRSFMSDTASTFLESQNFQDPTIIISSVSELTGGSSGSSKDPKSPVELSESGEEYLVIKDDSKGEENKGSSHDTPHESSPQSTSQVGNGRETSNPTRSHQYTLPASFSVIDNQEVLKALPVTGLSSASEAAKELMTESGNGVKSNEEARAVFERDHDNHFDTLMIQLMQSFGLSLSWLSVIKPLITEASRKVKTNVFVQDVMDINNYVKVKKIPGGQKRNSSLIFGVVCTKNVTHKKMNLSIRNPTILLLKCAFELQRRENQLSSFDTLQLQEEKYLKNLVTRVKTFKPSIILVQKSVSRLALEMLYELGVAVVVNVKPSVMARVARSTNGDLLHSLDQLFFDVRLGTCGHFYIRNFTLPDGVKKTLMYFDQCEPMLGCVITLQGGTKRELKKVKKVTCFGLYICRNSYLETSFLVDEFAWPLSLQPKLLPNTDDYSSTPSTPEWPLYPSLAFPVDSISPTELARKLAILAPASDQMAVPGVEDPLAEQCAEPSDSKVQFYISSTKGSSELKSDETHGDTSTSELHPPEASVAVETQEAHSPVNASKKETEAIPGSPALPTVSSEVLSHLGEKEFQSALENQLLSISPNILFPTPYLQMAPGMAADVRQYLPKVVYWSYQFKTRALNSSQSSGITSPMEMGLSKTTLQKSLGLESLSAHHLNERLCSKPSFKHSYKSVSDHPLTTSIFLLKANTNEMKTALADYRARAGLSDEADCFFFPAARRASDYRLHLQNMFNKYKQFEMAANAVDSEPADVESEDTEMNEAPPEVKSEGRPVKRRTKRWKAPEKSCSSSSDLSDHSEEFYVASRSPLERSMEIPKDIIAKSTSEHFGSSLEVPKKFERRSLEPIAEGFMDETQRVSKLTKSPSSKFSEKFGTLEDLDHNQSQEGGGEEEDNVDLGTGVTEEWAYDGWMAPYQLADCLNPLNHQGISILFSSTCHDGQKHQLPCVPPCIIPMNYYGRNDISLGEFLHRYCFRPFYRCQTCGMEMSKHQRHVVHGDSVLHISMQHLDAAFPGNSDKIYTWLACRHCAQCTPYVQMSEESLLFSFAKFLELRFYGSSYQTRYHSDGTSSCPHFMHKDYVQYFCCKNSIASFQPAPISLMEVCIPPRAASISTPHSEYHHDYGSEIKHVQRIIEGVFYRIRQKLQQYHMEPVTATIKDYAAGAKAERDTFRTKLKLLKELVVKEGFIETIVTMETSKQMGEQQSEDNLDSLQDGIADLKRKLTEVVECWNINLENVDAAVRAYRSKRDVSVTDGHSPHDSPSTTPSTNEGEGTSSNSETPVPSSFNVTPVQTPSFSPDSSHSTSQQTSSGYSDNSHSATQVHTQTHLRKPRSHSRNHSDSILQQIQTTAESTPKSDELKSPTQLNRQLSDSKSSSSLGDLSELGRTKQEQERVKEKLETGPGAPEDPPPSGDNDGSGVVAQGSSDGHSNALGQDEGGRDKVEYQRIKTMFSYYNQPARGDPSGRRSPHNQSAAQGDDSAHTDSSGGIFAKLRGKDADAREDPNKYYLLDPSELTNSPHLGAPNTLEPPNARPYRRPGSLPKKAAAYTAPSATEAFGDGRSGERRVVKERSGVLARPFQKLPAPFDMNEHHNMHWHVSIPVAIYEKEATSIIAYALSSHKYAQEMRAMQERKQNVSTPLEPLPASPKPFRKQMSEPEKPQISTSGNSKGSTFRAALQELRRKGSAISLFSGLSVSTMLSDQPDPPPLEKSSEDPKRLEGMKTRDASQMGTPEDDQAGSDPAASVGSRHISLEFTTPDKSASFFCKVYFAEEFYQLRKLIFPSGEERFVRSLSRCVKYDAKGGKSRSTFCKVADDRFILKQIKSVEISSFEQFAPQYFEHVTTALEEKRPLMLAKILGLYSIGYRNTKTGNSKRLDVIVMENLLYGHKSSKVFDLKGSMRSRYVDPSKESSGDVLLDENYLNYICNSPVYVYPHSKCVLMQGILADTEFLAKNSIMDYSLLTCIDEASGELVVGIIDYVRPFTLDKRLEMYFKKTAGRVLPTVVYPELYRKRFCDAMERYFTVVPDKWTGFGPN